MIAPMTLTLPEIKWSDGRLVTLRPERAGDEPLLFQLYASTREEELARTDWDEGTRARFLQSQFQAQGTGYRNLFPQADFSIVSLGSVASGRIVLNAAAAEIRLVDLVLAPAARQCGLGTALLSAVLSEAARQDKSVRLHVLRHSPAVRLYQRLGLRKIAELGLRDEMEWRPSVMKR